VRQTDKVDVVLCRFYMESGQKRFISRSSLGCMLFKVLIADVSSRTSPSGFLMDLNNQLLDPSASLSVKYGFGMYGRLLFFNNEGDACGEGTGVVTGEGVTDNTGPGANSLTRSTKFPTDEDLVRVVLVVAVKVDEI